MYTYNYTVKELEDTADAVKAVVISGLVTEGLITGEVGESWAETHTVVIAPKTFWRTISDKWNKQKSDDNQFYWLLVKRVKA